MTNPPPAPKPYQSRKQTRDGIVTRRVEGRGINATGYDTDQVHFMDVNIHGVTKVRIDPYGPHESSVTLYIDSDRGETLHVSLFGISLDTLVSALEAAQRAAAEVTA